MVFFTEKECHIQEEKIKEELIQKYGREMKCGDCFWFLSLDEGSDLDFDYESCSLYGHMAAGINSNSAACSKFELNIDAEGELCKNL